MVHIYTLKKRQNSPFFLFFFFFRFLNCVSKKNRTHTVPITFKLHRFEDDEARLTNSCSMYVCSAKE